MNRRAQSQEMDWYEARPVAHWVTGLDQTMAIVSNQNMFRIKQWILKEE
jgi:hypothetical protein